MKIKFGAHELVVNEPVALTPQPGDVLETRIEGVRIEHAPVGCNRHATKPTRSRGADLPSHEDVMAVFRKKPNKSLSIAAIADRMNFEVGSPGRDAIQRRVTKLIESGLVRIAPGDERKRFRSYQMVPAPMPVEAVKDA